QNEDLEAQVRERTHQLLETEKLATMGNLLAGVAHELNSPLSVILGHVALFAASASDDGTRARPQDIGRAAERCVRIVRSFLTMARRHPPEPGHVSVNQILKDAVELLAYELRVANIEVHLDLPDDLPRVWADGHQLQQVAVNLIANAKQAMLDVPTPRRLDLVARYDDPNRSVHVEIADTGRGIPPELQARIFEPFFTTTSDGEGTGRGLPVPGKTILVVDDEPGVASILAEALTRDGYMVDTAPNGAVALEKLGAQTYDLIISDSGMPVVSGPELYREVERREPRLARRFVFVTGDILNPRTREFL